ncbi:MAG TPA: hypothetical protein VFD30_02265 [Terriglobia bacterium]|nr:hypothetical protein [Terriglobia bacterium]
MISRMVVRSAWAAVLTLGLTLTGFAQTYPGPGSMGGGGNGTYNPNGGYKSSTGIAIGAAAAAGVAVAYLALHNRGTVSGCVETADGGPQLVDPKNKRTYALIPGSADLKPGERVSLKGRKIRSDNGEMSFEVQEVKKDYGPCAQ